MKLCTHYQLDSENNRYVSLAIRYLGDRSSSKCHRYKCKRCNMPLHTVDIVNLNNKINDLNRSLTGTDYFPFIDVTDIHDMLAPVPGTYDEDSKYRDNQLR